MKSKAAKALPATVVFAIGLLLAAGLFGKHASIFSSEPIGNADFTFHQFYASIGAKTLLQHAATWGYDPSFMAGAIHSPVFDPSNFLFAIAAAVLPFMGVGGAVKFVFLVGMALIPLLIMSAARSYGLSMRGASVAAALALVYLWFGLPLETARYGMFLFVLGSAWGVFTLGRWVAFSERGGAANAALLAVAGGMSVPIHISTLFAVAPSGAVSFLANARYFDKKKLALTGIAAVATVACVAPWLGPYFALSSLKTSSAVDLQGVGLFGLAKLVASGQASIELLLLLAGAAGFFSMSKRTPAKVWAPLLVGAVFPALLYFSGFREEIAELQPRRFAAPLYFLLCVPAAEGVAFVASKFADKSRSIKIGAVAALAVISVIAFAKSSSSVSRVMGSLQTGVPRGSAGLFEWLKTSTDRSGRIMIEDSGNVERLAIMGVPEGMSLIGLAPLFVEREFVGGPWPRTYIAPHAVDFQDGRFVGKPVGQYDAATMTAALALFNIKWAVTTSQESFRAFSTMPTVFKPIGQTGPFVVWQIVADTGGWFMEGSGELSATTNEIRVSNGSASNGAFVLKYQWSPCLKVVPSGAVERIQIPGVPLGFIGVTGAPNDFKVTVDYSDRIYPSCGKAFAK